MTKEQYEKYTIVSRQIIILNNIKFKSNDSKREFPTDVNSNDFFNSVKTIVDVIDEEISNLEKVLESI